MHTDWLQLRIGRSQFHVLAETKQSFERGADLIDQRYHNFAVTSFNAVFDQRDVTVTDVLVDHRVALHAQRINSFGPHTSEQEARDANHLDVFDRVDGSTSG